MNRPPHTSVSSRTKSDSLPPTSILSSGGTPKPRKVNHLSTGTGTGSDPLIPSTSSWRSGKTLAEKILGGGELDESSREEDGAEKESFDRSCSFDRDSHELDGDRGSLYTHQNSSSDVKHSVGLGHTHNPVTNGSRTEVLGGAVSSASSLLDARVAQLSSDMKDLMVELSMSPSSSSPHLVKEEEEGGERDRQPISSVSWRDGIGGRGVSVGVRASKKTKFTTGK